ncbi:MAG TPA: hypothetical protein VE863_02910 [Pyrinomonadaceae bacterium]|jgi:hypothetical protein|nr:hypothetical protein [Pyrinomonadaceae bacterium]
MATSNGNSANGHVGKVAQIIGPVVDLEFGEDHLPPIYQALRITSEGFDVPDPINVIAEVDRSCAAARLAEPPGARLRPSIRPFRGAGHRLRGCVPRHRHIEEAVEGGKKMQG